MVMHLQVRELGQRAGFRGDLCGQLPGGSQHECALDTLRRFVSSSRFEQGQREGRRLAGAGLGQAQDVASVESGGKGFVLNGTRLLEARGSRATNERGVESKLVEASGTRMILSRCSQILVSYVRVHFGTAGHGWVPTQTTVKG